MDEVVPGQPRPWRHWHWAGDSAVVTASASGRSPGGVALPAQPLSSQGLAWGCGLGLVPWPCSLCPQHLRGGREQAAQERTQFQGRAGALGVQCGRRVLTPAQVWRGTCGAGQVRPQAPQCSWGGGPVGPGISQKHSTFQMRGSLCGSQALVRQAGARELGVGPPLL